VAIRGKTNRLATAAVCALGIFAFVFLLMGRIDAALATPRGWALNLFTWVPGELSWNLGNLVYALLFGVICALVVGVPTGLLVGERKVAALVTLTSLLVAAALMAWLAPLDWWSVLLFGVVICVAPIVAWLSSTRRGAHAP